jgi:hypothetical protein
LEFWYKGDGVIIHNVCDVNGLNRLGELIESGGQEEDRLFEGKERCVAIDSDDGGGVMIKFMRPLL